MTLKTAMVWLIQAVCLLILFTLTKGHVRLVCPRPTTPASNVESSSVMPPDCPVEEGPPIITDLEPGLFTVHFEETKFMKGAPFRILLLDNSEVGPVVTNTSNFTSHDQEEERPSCMLLDHIPHNDHAIISDRCSKKGNEYPLGVCEESSYYITVRIPDGSCEDCFLVLQQVDVPIDHTVCDLSQGNNSVSNCFVFSSCARVRIRPTEAGAGNSLRECANYLDNIPGDWPYSPQDVYKTRHGAALTLDLLHNNLHIEIPKDPSKDDIKKIEILENLSVIWYASVDSAKGNVDAYLLTWKSLNESQVHSLRAGKYILNIVDYRKAIPADIVYVDQHFSKGKMSILHDMYSHRGWLISHKFFGPLVKDPVAAFPVGQCAPRAHHYVAYLHSVHITAHGVLGMTVIENRAYITAVLHEDKEIIQTIRIMPPDLVKVPTIRIDVPASFKGVVQAAIDLSDHLPQMETERFLKSVEVKTDKEDAVMIGDLEEGMYTVLRDENGRISGMGALQFTPSQGIRLEIVLNDLSPTIKAAHLYGLDKKLADISRSTIHCTHKFCCMEALLNDLSAELVLHLLNGHAVLHVDSGASNVSGQVMVPTQRYCEMKGGFCESQTMGFTFNGVGFNRKDNSKGGLESEMGWVQSGAYVLDRANVLIYCLLLKNVDITNQSLEVSFEVNNQLIHTKTLQPTPKLSNAYYDCSKIPFTTNTTTLPALSDLKKGNMRLMVKRGEEKMMFLKIPPVNRSNCTHTMIHEIGKNKDHWSSSSAPLDDIYAVVMDDLQFIFSENTTIFLANNKDAFDDCNFQEAQQMKETNIVYNMKTFYFHIKEPGTLFFMDEDSCNSSWPLKLVVHITRPENVVSTSSHNDWCLASVYSVWRNGLMDSWGAPDVSSPIIVGLVVGLSFSLVFLVWQGIKLRIIPDRFQRHESLF